jgi:hypothetical protein
MSETKVCRTSLGVHFPPTWAALKALRRSRRASAESRTVAALEASEHVVLRPQGAPGNLGGDLSGGEDRGEDGESTWRGRAIVRRDFDVLMPKDDRESSMSSGSILHLSA